MKQRAMAIAGILFVLLFNIAQARDPEPIYEFPTYRNPPVESNVDPMSCLSGYVLRTGYLGKDIYIVLDCLDKEYAESEL